MPQYRDDLTLDGAIREVFPSSDITGVLALLDDVCPGQPDRVRLAVVLLSEGRLDRLKHFAREATLDSRDVLYWAFSYEDEPPARLRHLLRLGEPG